MGVLKQSCQHKPAAANICLVCSYPLDNFFGKMLHLNLSVHTLFLIGSWSTCGRHVVKGIVVGTLVWSVA